jgi:MFS family permease
MPRAVITDRWSRLGSIFYFGYLISQYPAGYFLQRLRLGKVIGITMLIWGILIITTPACHSFGGIATNRFLLGLFEAVVRIASLQLCQRLVDADHDRFAGQPRLRLGDVYVL